MKTDEKDEEVTAKKAEDQVKYWLSEVADARKRERTFRKEGQRITKIYEGGKSDTEQYNILYSNTDTLAPALYNTTPRPVVQRRFKDEDPLGKDASLATQRTLEFLIDPADSDYTPFDDLMRSAVLEALVPGRGVTRFKYEAAIEGKDDAAKVSAESVCGEEVPWDRFLHGYAKKWNQVPWICFEHHMTKDELKENFGEELAKEIPVDESEVEVNEEDGKTDNSDGETSGAKLACVLEIWSKVHKKVFFIAEAYKDKPVKTVDDPLKLRGFYPCPKPLQFVQKITTLVPVALYKMYEEQSKELNLITVRINKLIKACRVHGMYDSTIEDMDKVLAAGDGILLPMNNVAAMVAQGLNLEKSVWIFPLDKIVGVLQQLYLARTQIKTVIFEITGIADIMRGSSQASETLGAQEIKNQWGTLRLKRIQKEVMRYVRDSLRIMAEIATTELDEKTLSAMTGLPYPTTEQKEQAGAMLQQLQQVGAGQSQVPPQPGQPPAQPDPRIQQLQGVVQQPGWGEILGLLRDDNLRSYRIDIETNSTVDAEATEDKQNISELLNAMAQFLNGVAPLIEQQILPFEAAQGMLLAIVRRFRFGSDVEDSLKQMKAPAPQDDGKAKAEQAKMQIEQQKMQQDMAAAAQQQQHDQQMAGVELQIAQQKADLERQSMMLDFKLKEQEHAMKMAELVMKGQIAQAQASAKLQAMQQQTITGTIAHNQSLEAGQQKADVNKAQADAKMKAAKAPPAKA